MGRRKVEAFDETLSTRGIIAHGYALEARLQCLRRMIVIMLKVLDNQTSNSR
jgi:hypothetical protein